jgi:hypothetical protein
MRKCRACYERERAEARAGRRRDDLEALAARGLRECDVCDGTGSLDVDDVDCGGWVARGGERNVVGDYRAG